MPTMLTPPSGTWPEPRDLTPRLMQGELPGPLFNLLDAGDYRECIEPYLDGSIREYTLVAHFDEPVREGPVVTDFARGRDSAMSFTSAAGTWREFRADFFSSVREFLRKESFRQFARFKLAKRK